MTASLERSKKIPALGKLLKVKKKKKPPQKWEQQYNIMKHWAHQNNKMVKRLNG